jgi:hypothetical protein
MAAIAVTVTLLRLWRARLRRAHPSPHAVGDRRRLVIQQAYTASELVPWIVDGALRGLLEVHPGQGGLLRQCHCRGTGRT